MIRARFIRVFFAIVALSLFTGCHTIKHAYVDNTFPTITKADLKPVASLGPVDVIVRWQTNGKDKIPPAGTPQLIARLLEQSGCFSKVNLDGKSSERKLEILINNHGDMGSAYASGFVTGLTFGGVGASATDYYAFSATWSRPPQAEWKCQYEHALISTSGLKSAPEGARAVPSDQGFPTIVTDLVYKMLKDMQDQGAL